MQTLFFRSPLRFIPACAGNRSERILDLRHRSVHPRVCGEQKHPEDPDHVPSGSSPRVRGTVSRQGDLNTPHRFIPACAGNRLNVSSRSLKGPVHPRVCGEQPAFIVGSSNTIGSSPRVRGTVQIPDCLRTRLRFIPACAGNSQGFPTGWVNPSVHPRVCGEQNRVPGTNTRANGSSPRVRGTDPVCDRVWKPDRFIPACAGNSRSARQRGVRPAVHPRVCGEQQPALPRQ